MILVDFYVCDESACVLCHAPAEPELTDGERHFYAALAWYAGAQLRKQGALCERHLGTFAAVMAGVAEAHARAKLAEVAAQSGGVS